MKKKCFILILSGLLLYNCNYAQKVTEQLNQFYKNADMDCYISKIQKNVNDYFILDNKIWGRDKYSIPPQKIELHNHEVVPMLTIQFVNTDTYNYNDDIYNFISIDSSIVFTLACVDKRMNVTAFANFFVWVSGYYEIGKDPSIKNPFDRMRYKHVIKNIYKQKPEIILFSHVLCGFHDDNGFMYIKNGRIYVYRPIERDVFELNEYIHRFFSLDRIRKLNYTYLPIIYQTDQVPRRTGQTHDNEKIMCP
jgi:hypothetical protein